MPVLPNRSFYMRRRSAATESEQFFYVHSLRFCVHPSSRIHQSVASTIVFIQKSSTEGGAGGLCPWIVFEKATKICNIFIFRVQQFGGAKKREKPTEQRVTAEGPDCDSPFLFPSSFMLLTFASPNVPSQVPNPSDFRQRSSGFHSEFGRVQSWRATIGDRRLVG